MNTYLSSAEANAYPHPRRLLVRPGRQSRKVPHMRPLRSLTEVNSEERRIARTDRHYSPFVAWLEKELRQ